MNAPTPLPELSVMTQIARHLATETYTLEQICRLFQFDKEYFDTEIAPNPYFQRVLEDYTKEWHSLGSSQKRLAFSALVALEEKLPGLATRMGDPRSGLADAVAVGKLLKELAGIATPSSQPAPGSGTPFSINISFGDSKVALKAIEATEIRSLPEGGSASSPLQQKSGRAQQESPVLVDATRPTEPTKTSG